MIRVSITGAGTLNSENHITNSVPAKLLYFDECAALPWNEYCRRMSKTESKEENNVADKRTQEQADNSNMQKNPDDWTTGDEPMTGAQRSYLKTLSEEANEPFDENLTKAQASKRIEELQQKTGRGSGASKQAGSDSSDK
jgi:hypothetical protein